MRVHVSKFVMEDGIKYTGGVHFVKHPFHPFSDGHDGNRDPQTSWATFTNSDWWDPEAFQSRCRNAISPGVFARCPNHL